jgi:glycosyltransferase involved in cell wall biosynthesis
VKTPDLAVIIPARNEAANIGACLDSVHQALAHAGVTAAEVIVVDDESSDETSAIARSRGALALRHVPRRGPLGAWTTGVASSSAPLLFFVDADCHVDKGAFAALLRGFERPEAGVVAARGEPDRGRAAGSLAGRSAAFSGLILHEVKSRLGSHDFVPIGRLMAVRREAWRGGDPRWPCDRVVASRAKRAGWEIVYAPEAVVHYGLIGTYREIRADYVRTVVAQSALCGDWAEPLPPGVVRRAALASMFRHPLSGAAWAAIRARLWTERARGLIRADEGSARWVRSPDGPATHQAAQEQSGVHA